MLGARLGESCRYPHMVAHGQSQTTTQGRNLSALNDPPVCAIESPHQAEPNALRSRRKQSHAARCAPEIIVRSGTETAGEGWIHDGSCLIRHRDGFLALA